MGPGAIQVLRIAFSREFDPHPPPRNANNVEPYTFVTFFPVKSDKPHTPWHYVTLEWLMLCNISRVRQGGIKECFKLVKLYIESIDLLSTVPLTLILCKESSTLSIILEWTTSFDSSSGTLICHSLCPRHVGRNNYVPLFGVDPIEWRLTRYYVIRDVIVIFEC